MILVFEEGCLIQQGAHAQLLESGGLYADMYARQMGTGNASGEASLQ
jgi:ABC-type multidrug transport system fused ATPase/permease subunit